MSTPLEIWLSLSLVNKAFFMFFCIVFVYTAYGLTMYDHLVMLSAAKHLNALRDRPFAAAQGDTRPTQHPLAFPT